MPSDFFWPTFSLSAGNNCKLNPVNVKLKPAPVLLEAADSVSGFEASSAEPVKYSHFLYYFFHIYSRTPSRSENASGKCDL